MLLRIKQCNFKFYLPNFSIVLHLYSTVNQEMREMMNKKFIVTSNCMRFLRNDRGNGNLS